MPRLVSLILMAALMVLLGLTFYHVMAPFLMPLFLAAVFAMLSQPLFERIRNKVGGRTYLAAGLTTAVVLMIVFLPLAIGIRAAAWQLKSSAADDGDRISTSDQPESPTRRALKDRDWKAVLAQLRTDPTVQKWVHKYGELTGEPVAIDEVEQEVDARLHEAAVALARRTLGLAGTTLTLLGVIVSALVGMLTFVIAFYYFLADGPRLIEATILLIPVQADYQRRLISRFDDAVRAVVLATFAAALGQGIATAIGMLGLGPRYFFLFMILATLTALVPLLGTWLIWGPYALYLAYTGHWWQAGLLTLYGSVFVGLLDNVIRTYVLQSNVKLHPLLAFVSVLGGLQALGLWGIFIGPIVASCLHALVQIFNTELALFPEQRQAGTVVDTAGDTTEIDAGVPKGRSEDPTDQEIDVDSALALPSTKVVAKAAKREEASPAKS